MTIRNLVSPFGTNYIYVATDQLMFRSSSISAVVTATKTIASLVRYCINGVSGHNRPVYVNKLSRLFLFKPADIVMKILEATNQLGGFNQRLPTRHPN